MLVLGIPVYACATASVPIAAALMFNQGVSPGAVLVFLMTGPATNAATIATVWKVMGKRTAILYVAAVMITALASGIIMNLAFETLGSPTAPKHVHEFPPAWVKNILAIVLLAVLAAPAVVSRVGRRIGRAENELERDPNMRTIELAVEGMTCSHCSGSVQRALSECAGVTSAEVVLETGRAIVTGEAPNAAALCAVVAELGYSAKANSSGGAQSTSR